MGPDERAAIAANEAFYRAFCARDVRAMEGLWAHDVPVSCVHPGRPPMRDRDTILRSWRAIFNEESMPEASAEDSQVSVMGAVACVTCYERLSGARGEDLGILVATNLFVREGGVWRLCHHHSSPLGLVADDDDDEPPPPMLN